MALMTGKGRNLVASIVVWAMMGVRFHAPLHATEVVFQKAASWNPDYKGLSYPIHAFGNFVYMGYTNGAALFDVSEPSKPFISHWIPFIFATPALDVQISGDYAYFFGKTEFSIYDIKDPLHPLLIGTAPTTEIRKAVLVGQRIFLALSSGLAVYDGLRFVSGVGGINAVGIDATATRVYVTGAGLKIFEVRPDGQLFGISTLTSVGPRDLIAVGSYIYVHKDNSFFDIIDVANSGAPAWVKTFSIDRLDSGKELWKVVGNRLYLRSQIVDVTNPIEPKAMGTFPWGQHALNGSRLFTGGYGLEVHDVANAATVRSLGKTNTHGYIYETAISGDLALVSVAGSGLEVVDLRTMKRLATCDVPGVGNAVGTPTLRGNLCYIAVGRYGVVVVDISNPENPRRVGTWQTPGSAREVVFKDGLALVAEYEGFSVFDANDPVNASCLSTNRTGGTVTRLNVRGDYAFVCDYELGLMVYNIANPRSPQRVRTWKPSQGERMTDIKFIGDFALVLGEYSLSALEVSNPAGFSPVAWVIGHGGYSLTLDRNVAYVNAGQSYHVWDVTSPSDPYFLATVAGAGGTRLVSGGELLYEAAPTELVAWNTRVNLNSRIQILELPLREFPVRATVRLRWSLDSVQPPNWNLRVLTEESSLLPLPAPSYDGSGNWHVDWPIPENTAAGASFSFRIRDEVSGEQNYSQWFSVVNSPQLEARANGGVSIVWSQLLTDYRLHTAESVEGPWNLVSIGIENGDGVYRYRPSAPAAARFFQLKIKE